MTEIRVEGGPRGIGGWLILPVIALCGTIVITAYNLLSPLGTLTGDSFATLRASFFDLLVLMAMSALVGLGIIVYGFYCLKLLFSHDRRTPARMIAFYIAGAAISAFEMLAAFHIASRFGQPNLRDGAGTELIRSLIACAIWIPYFLRSSRVKNTFVIDP